MRKSYSDALIGEVLNRTDIVNVISQYVKLKKTGKNHKGLCPFHNEKTPSFIVSEERQRYHCFGCGASGDVIEFVMNQEKLDFVDAIEYLAEQCGIRLEDYLKKTGSNMVLPDKTKLYDLMKDAARYYYGNLKGSASALDYLKKREINAKTVKSFGLGFATDNWDGIIKHLHFDKGYAVEDLLSCGLIIKRDNSPGYYDRFRNRIMFPIFDIRGRVVGFGGRVMDDSVPKYLNSPETDLFNKRNLLFGLNFAKRHTGGEKTIIIVEGYMDVIALNARGVKNVVASLGTALTENQAELLKRYGSEIVLSYDSDTAGQNAAVKAMAILEKTPCKVKVISLDGSKDPDEYVRKNGIEAFEKEIRNALPALDYRIKLLRNRFDRTNPRERIDYMEELRSLIDSIDEPLQKEIYLNKIKNEEPEVGSLLGKTMRYAGKSKFKPRGNPNRVYKVDSDMKHETVRVLLAAILTDGGAFKTVSRLIEGRDFVEKSHRDLYSAISMEYKAGRMPDIERLTDSLDIESIEEMTRIAEIDAKGMLAGKHPKGVLYGCLVAMRINRIENELKGFDKNNLEKEGDLVKIKELYNELNRYRNLRGRMDELNEFDLLPPGQKKGGESNYKSK